MMRENQRHRACPVANRGARIRRRSPAATTSPSEEKAMATLMKAAEFLAKAQRFSVTVDIGYDVEQDWGQKLEFGATRKLTVRRPDRMAVDITGRDGHPPRLPVRWQTACLLWSGREGLCHGAEIRRHRCGPGLLYPGPANAVTTGRDLLEQLAEDSQRTGRAKPLPRRRPRSLGRAASISPCAMTWSMRSCGSPRESSRCCNGSCSPISERTVNRNSGRTFTTGISAPEAPDSLFTFTPAEGAGHHQFVAAMDPDAGVNQQ